MKISKIAVVLLAGLMLVACGRSKDTQFYVLNPIPPKHMPGNFRYLKIGIDAINTPAYIEKPQLMIHTTANHVSLEEYHQWAEHLEKNIKRVVATDLETLLPGAIVENSPWDTKFKPTYHLQIDISQFEIDIHGDSILRAKYLIYNDERLIETGDAFYRQKIAVVNMSTLVMSMNCNLDRLARDLAKVFASLRLSSKT